MSERKTANFRLFKVTCPRCDGSGSITLRAAFPRLAEVLEAMPDGDWVEAPALAKHLEVNGTAMCNRLAKLERLGFVEREKPNGSPNRWRPVR